MSAVARPMAPVDIPRLGSPADAALRVRRLGTGGEAGGTVAHAQIQANLTIALRFRLRGTRCRLREGLKVAMAGAIRYPDGFVACMAQAADATVVADPVIVFEILGKATAFTDRVLKLCECQRTPSVQ